MKRLVAGGLLSLGVFFVVAAGLVRFYAAPALIRVPDSVSTESIAEAPNATFLEVSSSGPAIRTGRLRSTLEIRSDDAVSTGDRVVWNVYQTVTDVDRNVRISQSTDRIAFDRVTAKPIACCGEAIDGQPVRHEGLVYKFPFGVDRNASYRYFDNKVRTAQPISFKGVTNVRGVEAYRFEQVVPETVIDQRTVPGSLVGKPTQPTVSVDVVYRNNRTIWVEPTTGMFLNVQEQQKRVLRSVDGAETVVFEGNFAYTEKNAKNAVQRATDSARMITAVRDTAPFLFVLIGVVLVALGLYLGRISRRTSRPESDHELELPAQPRSQTLARSGFSQR